MSDAGLQVMVQDDGFLIGRMGPIGILIWFQTPDAERTRRVLEVLFPALAEDGEFGLITVVTPACAPVGPDVRALFDQGLRANRGLLMGTGTVILVEGVLGGLTRAIARTMSVVSRVPYPNNVFATVADAAKWLPQLLSHCDPPPPTTQEIIDAVSPKLARS